MSGGTYTCTITDANGCDFIANTVIIIDPLLITSDSTIKTDITCHGFNDGTATVINLSGGTPGYTYLWDDPLNQTTASATGLLAGTYTCTITDANGCDFIASSVTTIDPPALVIDGISLNPVTCYAECDASITSIQVSGGTPFTGPYSYLYSVNGGLPHPNMSYFNGYCAGTYTVEVTDLYCATSTY